MNWHKYEEKPKYDTLCVIKIVNDTTKKLDYALARFKKVWVYKTERKVTSQITAWAYINEPIK